MLVLLVSLLSRLLLVSAQPQSPLLSCKKSLELPCDGNNCVQRDKVTGNFIYKVVTLIALIDLSSVITNYAVKSSMNGIPSLSLSLSLSLLKD